MVSSKAELGLNMNTSDYENEFISLTDIAKKREGEYPGYVIQNWMRNRSVISFIGLWEALHNPNFNCLEFEAIKNEAGDVSQRRLFCSEKIIWVA